MLFVSDTFSCQIQKNDRDSDAGTHKGVWDKTGDE